MTLTILAVEVLLFFSSILFIFLTAAHRFIFSNFILLKADLSNWIFIGNEDEYQVFEKDKKQLQIKLNQPHTCESK